MNHRRAEAWKDTEEGGVVDHQLQVREPCQLLRQRSLLLRVGEIRTADVDPNRMCRLESG
jgi:hypothetical protein